MRVFVDGVFFAEWSGTLSDLAAFSGIDQMRLSQDPAEVAADNWATYRAQAQAALTRSDTTVLRCIEAGVTLPTAWIAYRVALRAIVGASTGTPSTLPIQPPYPTGT